MGRVAAIAAAAAAAGSCAQAAEWRFAPHAGATVVSESNPRMATEAAEDQQAVAVDLDVNIEAKSERSSFALSSSAAHRRYGNDASLNRSDLRVNTSLQHAASERISWSTGASVTRDTTLTSELGTTGETRVGHRHESVGMQLLPTWQVSERWSTTLMMQLQSDFYPSAEIGLVDYTYLSTGLTNTWRRSAQDSMAIVVRAGRLRADQSPVDITDANAQLQYTRTINERWNLTLAVGPAWTRGTGSTQRGESYNFELTRGEQYGAVSLLADRGLAPTGRGYMSRRDSLSLQLRRELSPHMTGTLSARYLHSRNVVGAQDITFDDVSYRRAEAGLNWSFSPQWSTNFHAGYAEQRQRQISTRASGVDLGLGIRWSGKNHVF
jgi:hypothetical protein